MKHSLCAALIAFSLGFGLTACQTLHANPAQVVTDDEIKTSHERTRLLTLVYHWLALIEDPNHTAEPFKEIIADDISFNFSSGTITDFEGLSNWLYGTASSVDYSRHVLSNFTFRSLDTNLYELNVDMDWQGLLPSGQRMTAKTRHKWVVTNNPLDRFARIQKIDVDIVEPFTIVE